MGSLCIYPNGCRGQQVLQEIQKQSRETRKFQRTFEFGLPEGDTRDVARNTLDQMESETNE